jgi:RNA polymerase sigma-70 factor, ECF subfamily
MSEQAYVIAVQPETSLAARLWGAAPSAALHKQQGVVSDARLQKGAIRAEKATLHTSEAVTETELLSGGSTTAVDLHTHTETAAGSSPEAILFKDFLAGDDQAFTKLFKAHNQRIFAYCYKMLGAEEQAQDLAQEVWEKVIELRNDPPVVENPVGFLMRITRNKCLDVIKLRKNHSSLSDLDDHQHPFEEEHEGSAEEDIVMGALDKLPPEQKEVLVLNIYNGYRFDEIAEMLGKSPDAIWARASRGRAALRKMVMEAMSGQGLSNRYKDTAKSGKPAKAGKNGKEETV